MAVAGSGGRTLSVPNDMQGVNDILRSLEEGSLMTAFFKTKKPESGQFRVKLETRELIGGRIRGLFITCSQHHHHHHHHHHQGP